METPRPHNLPIHCRRRAKQELVLGKESASQLQILFNNPLGDDGLGSAEELVAKVLRSFTETLSILKSGDSDEVCQSPAAPGRVNSRCLDDRRREGSRQSRKSPPLRDRRGGYKKRKCFQTWTRVTPFPVDDGHAWRKYGRKEILNAKYPRNYFRCSHKNDEGCQATKQVQRMDEEPPVFRTTYAGHHTCKDGLRAPPQVFSLESTTPRESNPLPHLESKVSAEINGDPHPFMSSYPTSKLEFQEEMTGNRASDYLMESDYLLSPDLKTFESCGSPTMLSTLDPVQGHVISGVYSTCSTDSHSVYMGLKAGSVDDVDAMFQFDQDEL